MARTIRDRINKIKTKIEELNSQITTLQHYCLHPNVVKTAKSDTGNYDPSCNAYWFEFKCPDCGKFWTEPQ